MRRLDEVINDAAAGDVLALPGCRRVRPTTRGTPFVVEGAEAWVDTPTGRVCVDAEFVPTLRRLRWTTAGVHRTVRAHCVDAATGRRTTVFLTRAVLGLAGVAVGGRHVRHVNGDPLDNRLANLLVDGRCAARAHAWSSVTMGTNVATRRGMYIATVGVGTEVLSDRTFADPVEATAWARAEEARVRAERGLPAVDAVFRNRGETSGGGVDDGPTERTVDHRRGGRGAQPPAGGGRCAAAGEDLQ